MCSTNCVWFIFCNFAYRLIFSSPQHFFAGQSLGESEVFRRISRRCTSRACRKCFFLLLFSLLISATQPERPATLTAEERQELTTNEIEWLLDFSFGVLRVRARKKGGTFSNVERCDQLGSASGPATEIVNF